MRVRVRQRERERDNTRTKFKEVKAIGSITSKKLAGNSSVSNTIVTNLKSEQHLV